MRKPESTPLEMLITKRVQIVKMTILHHGTDTSVMGPEELAVLDSLITSIVTILTLYEIFEKVQNAVL